MNDPFPWPRPSEILVLLLCVSMMVFLFYSCQEDYKKDSQRYRDSRRCVDGLVWEKDLTEKFWKETNTKCAELEP